MLLDTSQFSYQCVHLIHAKVFSVQSNYAEGLHFSVFHSNCDVHLYYYSDSTYSQRAYYFALQEKANNG